MEARLAYLLDSYKDGPVSPTVSLEIKQIRLALKTVDTKMDSIQEETIEHPLIYNERNIMPPSGTVPSKVAKNNRVLSRVAK